MGVQAERDELAAVVRRRDGSDVVADGDGKPLERATEVA